MKGSVSDDFDGRQPKAIVLDDHRLSRQSISRRLRGQGFHVEECASVDEFLAVWWPGMYDLIVADWQLSARLSIYGDKVLEEVRRRDWDVPFVLVSGKLDEAEADRRASVFQGLLHQHNAGFVVRGEDGIDKVYEEATRLLERRDTTLLSIILDLRDAAEKGVVIKTTSGDLPVKEQLAELVADPEFSHDALRPLSKARGARFKSGQ